MSLGSTDIRGAEACLPSSLRYLDWCGYPAKSLPCFQPNEPIELVQLHLQQSKIEFLWEGMKVRVLVIILLYYSKLSLFF